MGSDTRKCPDCKTVKGRDEFYAIRTSKTGMSVYCRPCTKTRTDAWHRKTAERRKTEVSRQPESRKMYRAARKAQGLCVDCPNPVRKSGVVHCDFCHTAMLERQKQYASTRPWVKAANHRLRYHGVTADRWVDMLFESGGRCGICKNFFMQTPRLDHNHTTKRVRGLLCHRCNAGLAYVEESGFAEKAIAYLRRVECQTPEYQLR